jgi:hypothetical protein
MSGFFWASSHGEPALSKLALKAGPSKGRRGAPLELPPSAERA